MCENAKSKAPIVERNSNESQMLFIKIQGPFDNKKVFSLIEFLPRFRFIFSGRGQKTTNFSIERAASYQALECQIKIYFVSSSLTTVHSRFRFFFFRRETNKKFQDQNRKKSIRDHKLCRDHECVAVLSNLVIYSSAEIHLSAENARKF